MVCGRPEHDPERVKAAAAARLHGRIVGLRESLASRTDCMSRPPPPGGAAACPSMENCAERARCRDNACAETRGTLQRVT